MKRLSVKHIRSFGMSGLMAFAFAMDVFAGGSFAAPVQVVPAVKIDLAPVIWVPGTVIGRHDSKIAAEVEGRIDEVIEVGDLIQKGDVIARLDDITFRMQVEEAEAEIIPIEARLAFYKREVARLEQLAEQNNAAKNRLDEVKSNHDEMLGQLTIRRVRLAQMRDKFKRTVVYAPFEGVVMERYKTMAEWVDAGDEIVRLINTNELEIQVRVQQSSVSFIKQSQSLTVADGNKQITAPIRTIVPVGDDVSRLYEIRLVGEQSRMKEYSWMTGHAVRVAVPTAATRNVVAVPHDALVIRQSKTKIFRIQQDNTAEAIPVITGMANDQLIEVKGDVSVGDLIVTRGNERLRPAQQVIIQQGSAKP